MGMKHLTMFAFLVIFLFIFLGIIGFLFGEEDEQVTVKGLVLFCDAADCEWIKIEAIEVAFEGSEEGDCRELLIVPPTTSRLFQCGEYKK